MLTLKQRTIAFAACALLTLCAFGYGIAEKEMIKANSQTVLMELAPVDPRSLMQGDYMVLRYKAAENIPVPAGMNLIRAGGLPFHGDYNTPHRGYAVFAPDASGIARYIRIDDEKTPLQQGQFKMRFHAQYGRARIVPDSFMFQEGLRATYQPARFGIFKVDDRGRVLLTGLADADHKEITPETHFKTER
ncbi:MAG: GDYXXLXY domain-containing protein [Alphaproteobacteria bacterium]